MNQPQEPTREELSDRLDELLPLWTDETEPNKKEALSAEITAVVKQYMNLSGYGGERV